MTVKKTENSRRSDKPKWFMWAMTTLISLSLLLVLSEMSVRLVAPQNLSGTWLLQGPQGLRMNRPNSTARHQFGDRVLQYRFNDVHARGGPLRPNSTRIQVLGDSYVFGWLLEEQDTYTGILNAMSDRHFRDSNLEFVNAGVGGWGSADVLAYLEEVPNTISPRMIILFTNAWDLNRSINSGLYILEDQIKPRLIRQNTNHVDLSIRSVIRSIPGYQWLLEHSHLVQFLRQTVVKFEIHRKTAVDARAATGMRENTDTNEISSIEAGMRETRGRFASALYERLKNWAEKRDVGFLVVVIGGWSDHYATPSISQILSKHGIASIDLRRSLENKLTTVGLDSDGMSLHEITREYQIPGDGHPNEKWTHLMIGLLWDRLVPHINHLRK